MNERYNIIDNDLIPDTELEVRFEQIKELLGRGGKPYLLIKLRVREDVNENGAFKGRELVDFFNRENNSNRYKGRQINGIINTQDLAKVKQAFPNLNFTIEQLAVFLVGKNARIQIVIETNEYGTKNKIKRYMKTHYVPVEKKPATKVVEDDDIVLDDDFYKDLPF